MASRAVDPFARRITYRMQTQDVRKYLITDVVRRAENALERAGGTLVRRASPPKRIKRWCVNRSPHVNKTSREHFWMITHTRIVEWDADRNVDLDAPVVIATNLPGIMATRMEDDMPALMALPVAWDLLHSSEEIVQSDVVGEASHSEPGAVEGDVDTSASAVADGVNMQGEERKV